MLYNRLRPFLKADTGAAGGTGVPAATAAEQAPIAHTSGSSDAFPHPLDARARDIMDDSEDESLEQAFAKQSERSSRGNEETSEQRPSMFEEGFDPTTLEEPLQGKYSEMEAAFQERMSQLPDAEVMQSLGMKANAFDRLVQMPEFQSWAEGMTGSEPSPGRQAAAEASENLLDGLDEDVQTAIADLIQRRVDEAITDRVAPLSDAFYADKAEATISQLREQVGAETFERLAPQMQMLMEGNENLDLEDALKLAQYDEMKAQLARRTQETVRDKFQANMEGDGSTGTMPSTRKIKDARSAAELAFEMVSSRHPGAFDPTVLPPGYRGE